jgi:hypothetical protein
MNSSQLGPMKLSGVHIVRDPSDFKPKMLPFVRAFLLHFWAHDSEDYTAAEAAPVPIGHE